MIVNTIMGIVINIIYKYSDGLENNLYEKFFHHTRTHIQSDFLIFDYLNFLTFLYFLKFFSRLKCVLILQIVLRYPRFELIINF